jgi:hypothetical protein
VKPLRLDFVPIPARDVESTAFDGERLVWRGAALHRLDTVGGLVWECFDGRSTLREISRMLADSFAATEADVQRDIATMCEELLDEGLLEGGEPRRWEPDPPPRPGRPPDKPLAPDRTVPHATTRFVALGFDFAVRTDDARLAAYFDRVLASFANSGTPARWYSVVKADDADAFDIYFGEEGLLGGADADLVARYLLWHVNYEVIATTATHLLIHASGATIGGQAVVLPGVMDAGKTTLVGGLVLDGFGFLTDELVALNLRTGRIDPYPRPLNIGRGSWDVLAALRPADRDEDDPIPRLAWHVDPGSIRPDAVARPAALRWVIAPRFRRGSPTRLEPLSRPEAVALLHRHAFNREQAGAVGVRALVEAVRQARCTRLENGDLAEAVAAVRRFVGETKAPRGR